MLSYTGCLVLSLSVHTYSLKDSLEEDGAYLDVDLVEFHDEDFRDITTILKLSDTTKDKLTFTVSYLVSQTLCLHTDSGLCAYVQWHIQCACWCSGTLFPSLENQTTPFCSTGSQDYLQSKLLVKVIHLY